MTCWRGLPKEQRKKLMEFGQFLMDKEEKLEFYAGEEKQPRPGTIGGTPYRVLRLRRKCGAQLKATGE